MKARNLICRCCIDMNVWFQIEWCLLSLGVRDSCWLMVVEMTLKTNTLYWNGWCFSFFGKVYFNLYCWKNVFSKPFNLLQFAFFYTGLQYFHFNKNTKKIYMSQTSVGTFWERACMNKLKLLLLKDLIAITYPRSIIKNVILKWLL